MQKTLSNPSQFFAHFQGGGGPSPQILCKVCTDLEGAGGPWGRGALSRKLPTFQVVEVQPSTGVPHHHSVSWTQLESGVRNSLERLQQLDTTLKREDLDGLITLAQNAFSVTLSAERLSRQFPWLSASQASQVVELAGRVQLHTCGDTCTNSPREGQLCGMYFPRLPSLFTLVSKLPDLDNRQSQQLLASVQQLQSKVQEHLRELHRTGHLLTTSLSSLLTLVDSSAPEGSRETGFTWGGLTVSPGSDLDFVLDQCTCLADLSKEERKRLVCWQYSLLYRRRPRIIPQRLVTEVYIVNYNPSILLSLKANHEVELICSTPHNVYKYVTKGGSGPSITTLKAAISELEERGKVEIARALDNMLTSGGMREVTLAEAFYRLLNLRLSHCNTTGVHSDLGHLDRVDVGEERKNEEEDEVECKEEDEEIEVTDDYCLRPLDLEPLSAAQFKLFYRLAKPGEEDREPHAGREVPVVTPADIPPLPHQKSVLQQKLPVLRPDGSTVVYKLVKKPRILTWSPQSTYSDLYMFKVRQIARSKGLP